MIKNFIKKAEPYQIFFFIGILSGVAGVGLWVLFWLQNKNYPRDTHASLMIFGFLFFVAIGFLMTAIPRFTGSKLATFSEKTRTLALVFAGLATVFLQQKLFFYIFTLLIFLNLALFAAVRLKKGSFYPPPAFMIVGVSLVGTFLGLIGLIVSDLFSLSFEIRNLSRTLALYSFTEGSILGVGTHLIPMILGLAQPFNLQETSFKKKKIRFFGFVSFIFFGSFFIEALINPVIGRLLRALLITGVVVSQWRIYKKPQTKGVLSWCLWASSWMFVLGEWPGALFPNYHLHGIHVLFIGSVSLMIFAIATRVTVAHGGHDPQLQIKSKALATLFVFFTLALITRLVAPFITNYISHLAYAAFFWILAVLTWGLQFFPLLLRKNVEKINQPHC